MDEPPPAVAFDLAVCLVCFFKDVDLFLCLVANARSSRIRQQQRVTGLLHAVVLLARNSAEIALASSLAASLSLANTKVQNKK